MDTQHSFGQPPDKLLRRLKSKDGADNFRMRSVVTRSNGTWKLICCTVESFVSSTVVPGATSSRRYDNMILEEQWWSRSDCLAFISEMIIGKVKFGGELMQRGATCQWTTEFKAAENDVMRSAGNVISMYFDQSGPPTLVSDLVSATEPYYPDHAEAARDWLPFLTYHGTSDGRNGCVVFLLPETKAFITGATHSHDGILSVQIGGDEVSGLSLLVKGAYWEKQKIHHFEAPVADSVASVTVPQESERLEYFLLDRDANVYGFHKESGGVLRSTPNHGTTKITLSPVARLRKSLQEGEGQRVEFKLFLDIEQKAASPQSKVKLQATVEAVVAFSNAEGGSIYLGVNDDCVITGVEEKIAQWANTKVDADVITRYLGALKSKLKNAISGEVSLDVASVPVDGLLVVAIEVAPAARKPVSIHQDKHFYIRSGASNRKLSPNEWAGTIGNTNVLMNF